MRYAILLLFFVSGMAYGVGQWTPFGNANKLESYGTGVIVYGLDFSVNPSDCVNYGRASADQNLTEERKNRLNSIILSAYMASKDVRLKLRETGCSSGGMPIYYAVEISD